MVDLRGPIGLASARTSGLLTQRDDDQRRRESFERVAPKQLAPPPKLDIPEPGGIGSALGSVAMGAFGLLDLPGSMVRDALTGNNPLDQLLTPFDVEKNRTFGEDIIFGDTEAQSTAGAVGRFGAGMAFDILTDPLTYMSFGLTGALKATKAGRALKKAGLVDDAMFAANERLVKAGSKKAGKKVGKREAIFQPDGVTTRDIAETSLTGDEVGRAFEATRTNRKKFDAALRQDKSLKNVSEEAFKQESDKLYNQKLRDVTDGYFRFSVPFKPDIGVSFYKGEKAAKLARVTDKLGDVTRFGRYSPVLYAAPYFSKVANKARTVKGQRQAQLEADRLIETQAIARQKVSDSIANINRSMPELSMVSAVDEAGNPLMRDGAPVFDDAATRDKTRQIREKMTEYMEDIGRERTVVRGSVEDGTAVYRPTDESFASWKSDLIANDEDFARMNDLGVLDSLDQMKDELRSALEYAEKNGIDLPELQDMYASYSPRVVTAPDKPTKTKGSKVYDPNTDASNARKDHRRNILGGTATLNRMSRDKTFAGAADEIRQAGLYDSEYARFISEAPEDEGYGAFLKALDDDQKKQLFNEVIYRSKDDVTNGIGFYADDIGQNVMQGLESLYRASAKASGLREFLRKEVNVADTAARLAELRRLRKEFGETSFANGDDGAGDLALQTMFAGDLPLQKIKIRQGDPEEMLPGSIAPEIPGPDSGPRPVFPDDIDRAKKAKKKNVEELSDDEVNEVVEDLSKGDADDLADAAEITGKSVDADESMSPSTARKVRTRGKTAAKKKAAKKKVTKKKAGKTRAERSAENKKKAAEERAEIESVKEPKKPRDETKPTSAELSTRSAGRAYKEGDEYLVFDAEFLSKPDGVMFTASDINRSKAFAENMEVPPTLTARQAAENQAVLKSRILEVFGKEEYTDVELAKKILEFDEEGKGLKSLTDKQKKRVEKLSKLPEKGTKGETRTGIQGKDSDFLKDVAKKRSGIDLYLPKESTGKKRMRSPIIDEVMPDWAVADLATLRNGERLPNDLELYYKANKDAIERRHPKAFDGIDVDKLGKQSGKASKKAESKTTTAAAKEQPGLIDTASKPAKATKVAEEAKADDLLFTAEQTSKSRKVVELNKLIDDNKDLIVAAGGDPKAIRNLNKAPKLQALRALKSSAAEVAEKTPVEEAAEAQVSGTLKNSKGRDVSPADINEAEASNPRAFAEAKDKAKAEKAARDKAKASETVKADDSQDTTALVADAIQSESKSVREAAEKAADEKIAAAAARTTTKRPTKGGGLSSKMKQKGKAEDTKPDAPAKKSSPLNVKAKYENASNRVGIGTASAIAKVIDSGTQGYTPKLSSASKDFAQIVEQNKPDFMSLEDFLRSDDPALATMKMAMASNGTYESVLQQAFIHDKRVRRLSVDALELSDGRPNFDGGKAWDFAHRNAAKLYSDGKYTDSSEIVDLVRPLHDSNGRFLGSFDADAYRDPAAIVRYAERTTGRKLWDEAAYDTVTDFIEEDPDGFARAVYAIRDKIDNGVDAGVKFDDSIDPTRIFFQTVEDLSDEEGFFTVPFVSNVILRMNAAGLKKDTARVSRKLFEGGNIKAEEFRDLRLDEFFNLNPNPTRKAVVDWVERNSPKIEIVDLAKTNRTEFAGYMVPGGDRSSYVELLVKSSDGRGGGYRHINNFEFDDAGHFTENALPDEGFVSGSRIEGRDTSENILVHLRMNAYDVEVGGETKRILRVQEVQSDVAQRMKEMETAASRINGPDSPFNFDTGFLDTKLRGAARSYRRDSQGFASATEKLKAEIVGTLERGGMPSSEALDLVENGDINKYLRNRNRLDNLGMDEFDPDTPFSTTNQMLGFKTALRYAVKNGFDGIALADGNDVGRIVGNAKHAQLLETKYKKLGKDINNYLSNFYKEKNIFNTPFKGAEPINFAIDRVDDVAVTAAKMKTRRMSDGVWHVGYDTEGIPLNIVQDPRDDLFYVYKDGVKGKYDDIKPNRGPDVAQEELEAEASRGFKSMTGAKKLAAKMMNERSIEEEMVEMHLTRDAKRWIFNQELKDYIGSESPQTMWQGRTTGRSAKIQFPRGDVASNEQWMKSQYMTQIIAFDQADAYSFAHEAGHLWRNSLAWKSPEMYNRAKALFGMKGDDWSAQVFNPVLGKKTSAEEAFADQFMEWIRSGGPNRVPETETDTMWARFKNFIGHAYKQAVNRGQDRDFTQEMHVFFDDLLGADKATKFAPTGLTQVLDSVKYSSPRALAAFMDGIEPDTLKRAEDAALAVRVAKARDKKVLELTKAGKADAESLVPGTDVLIADMRDKLSQTAQIPESVSLGSGSKETLVSIDPRISKRELLSQFDLPEDIAADVQRVYGTTLDLSNDEVAQGFVDGIDKALNVFKTAVTTPWPAFHVRNAFGALVQFSLNGVYDPFRPAATRHIGVIKDGANLLTGGKVEGLDKIPYLAKFEGDLDDEVRKMAFSFGVFDSPGQHRDLHGSLQTPRTSLLGVENSEGKGLASRLWDYWKRGAKLDLESETQKGMMGRILSQGNPANIAGGRGSHTRFIGARAGIPVGDLTEGSVRLGGFIALLKQGYDPAEAAKRIRMLQVDYSDLTDFERRYMRRVFPFYTYAKGMQKYLTNELVTKPGGPITQTMRFQARSADNDARTPEYIRRGTAIRLPSAAGDETRSYITGFGLMHEPAIGVLDRVAAALPVVGQGDLAGLAYGSLAASNPVPKGLYEYASGVSLFRESPLGGGERLSNLDPPVGRALSNVGKTIGLVDPERRDAVQLPRLLEVGISNSPASRAVSTVRSLTDERKSLPQKLLNFGTGLRITTLSPEKQEFTLQQRAEELMRELGGRAFERTYIPKERLERLSPENRAKAEELNQILNQLSQKRRQRAALKQMQQDQLK